MIGMKRGLTVIGEIGMGTQIDKTILLLKVAKLSLKEGAVIEEMTIIKERNLLRQNN